jgi:hypothetical protein
MEPETTLRVRDWDANYENNRTRGYKRLNWVPIPNKMDGDGYTELVDHPNGAAHLGAWLAIVQVASRCEQRGVLARDGGRPHDAASLARITRLPREIFDEVLPRLLAIGWIEHQPDVTLQDAAEIPQDAAEPSQFEYAERNGTERNRKERNGTDGSEMLITPERITEAKRKLGAHRGRGDQPDDTIVRRILKAFPDQQSADAWADTLIERIDPRRITGTGYGIYVTNAEEWVRNGGGRAPVTAAPPAGHSTVDPETRRRIQEARKKGEEAA